MSKIKFFALGGLGEDGKNMYCLDIDNKLFILDAGLKYPDLELYGVDSIIPDITYLEENKNRIKGLFLSHGHEDHIGAVPRLLKSIQVPIYGTNFTLAILKDAMEDQGMDVGQYKFHSVNSNKTLNFNGVKVSFYNTTHSLPECVGIIVHTPDGAIVYAPDYTFDQNVDKAYKTSFNKLSKISSMKILLLLNESLGAARIGHTNSNHNLNFSLKQAFRKAEARIIVSTFSTDLYRIQRVIDVALKMDKDIVIIGRKTQRIVDIAINLGYLRVPQKKLLNLKFIDDKNKNALPNAVILVTGERHEPFYMLQRMSKKLDRLIHLRHDDTVISMTPPIPGTEKIAARTLDTLHRNNINVTTISRDNLPPSHASSEDIKLLTNILQPKYVVPVIGEYRHQHAQYGVMKQIGYKNNQVILLDNGEVIEFDNGKLNPKHKKIQTGDILVDGLIAGDLNNVVMRDRELLSQDGVLLVIGNIDARKKKILTKPEVVSRGFIYMKENEELISKVTEIYNNVIINQLKERYIDWRVLKDAIRDDISKYLYSETKRRPIVIPVVIDTQV